MLSPGAVRSAFRRLLRSRVATASALLSLAVGIGLNTALFSVVHAVLLEPLPYADAGRLVLLWGSLSETERRGLSGPNLEDIRAQSDTLEHVAGFVSGLTATLDEGAGQSIACTYADPALFPLLGARVVLGRGLLGARLGQDDREVVLSNSLWRERFGADARIVGKSIRVNGDVYIVAGVTGADFFFPDSETQAWLPLSRFPTGSADRATPVVYAAARMRDGVSLKSVKDEMTVVVQRLRSSYPNVNRELRVGVFTVNHVMLGRYQSALWALFVAVVLVLLLSCVNIGALLLAQGIAREQEFAVRLAQGATRSHIIRQLLMESQALALVGATVGVSVGWLIITLLGTVELRDIRRMDRASLDIPTLTFALALSMLAGAIFGIIPAVRGSRSSIAACLKVGGSSSPTRSHRELGELVIFCDVTIAMALLGSAGLFIDSFVRLNRVEWGIEPDHVLSVVVQTSHWQSHADEQRKEITDRALQRVTQIPGVVSAAMGGGTPANKWSQHWPTRLAADGRFATIGWAAAGWVVTSDFFRTLGMTIIAGRSYGPEDTKSQAHTVVIDKALADRLWPGLNPVGHHVTTLQLSAKAAESGRGPGGRLYQSTIVDPTAWEAAGEPLEVIGVVANVPVFGLVERIPALYLNYAQVTPVQRVSQFQQFVIKTTGDPLVLAPYIRDRILAADDRFRIVDVSTVTDIINRSIGGRGSPRLLALISTVASGSGLLLAVAGLYGVTAFVIRGRMRELGIRVALGATRADIVRLVLSRGVLTMTLGVLAGTIVTLVMTKALAGLLFDIGRHDPVVVAGAAGALWLVGLAACYVPARFAACRDPLTILRTE